MQDNGERNGAYARVEQCPRQRPERSEDAERERAAEGGFFRHASFL